jgi:ATP-dependent Clp protease ATP-binding subunit ClpA
MFERFTEQARQVVVLAQEEARTMKHSHIGTEHLLLGLIRSDGIAADALAQLGVELDAARAAIAAIVGPGDQMTEGQIPFTPRAKKVMELALREALSLGHDYVGSEHLLLGLIREDDGIAARILREGGAGRDRIRQIVLEDISDPARAQPVSRAHYRVTRRVGVDPVWLGDVCEALEGLSAEIRRELHRDPDSGDLLLALASATGGPAARALSELGVDLDALAAAVERHRTEQSRLQQANLAELRRRLGLRGS